MGSGDRFEAFSCDGKVEAEYGNTPVHLPAPGDEKDDG